MNKKRLVLAALLSIALCALLCSCSQGVQIAHASSMNIYCNSADGMIAKNPVAPAKQMAPGTPVGTYRK